MSQQLHVSRLGRPHGLVVQRPCFEAISKFKIEEFEKQFFSPKMGSLPQILTELHQIGYVGRGWEGESPQ